MINLNHYKFDNPICQECIQKNIKKYGEFKIECEGITVYRDIEKAISLGNSEEDAKWTFDPTYFFEQVYQNPPRDYQIPLLLCTSRRLVTRQCRQTGKTLTYMFKIIHFLVTNAKKTVLVIAPGKALLDKMWNEYIMRDCIDNNVMLASSVVSKKKSPHYLLTFSNQSQLIMMIGSDNARGQTSDWLYIDEAAILNKKVLESIMMTSASKKDNVVLLSSTPKGRDGLFHKSCTSDPIYNEYHVPITIVESMKNQIEWFKKELGETVFIQEALAEFPDGAGGPFNYKGIDAAKANYEYEDCAPEHGYIYIGGVDWNGPGIGTYFYVIAFDPVKGFIQVVDKSVVSSAEWNSTVAKNKLIELNTKWDILHWMCDAGYGHSIMEDLKLFSMNAQNPNGRDAQIKHILEAVPFGEWIDIEDPFTKKIAKKTTKSFIVSQMSRLVELKQNGASNFMFSVHDVELLTSLEQYASLGTSDKGVERYGFPKGSDMEDHAIDALMLAVWGVIKYYGELFKRIVHSSIGFNVKDLLVISENMNQNNDLLTTGMGSSIMLAKEIQGLNLSDNFNQNSQVILSRGLSTIPGNGTRSLGRANMQRFRR